MNTKKNLPIPLTKVLQNDDSNHQSIQINIALLNPQWREVFANSIVFKPVLINERQYIYTSDVERDEFDKFWNTTGQKELEAGPHDGCRGIITGLAIMLFLFALIMMAIMSCAPKQYAPVNRSVDDPARSYQTINR